MAVSWPVDKLGLCNSALALTGDLPIATADDGSEEWNVASPAYERALAFMLEDHGWVHATKVNPDLQPSPTAPADTGWDTAYSLPADLLHLIWVKLDERPILYDILAGQIVINALGGTGELSIKYVSMDNSDPTSATPTFVLALQSFVMAGIYRGLHGDVVEAEKMAGQAFAIAQRAKTRSDQQKPKRQLWNSRISAARFGRLGPPR